MIRYSDNVFTHLNFTIIDSSTIVLISTNFPCISLLLNILTPVMFKNILNPNPSNNLNGSKSIANAEQKKIKFLLLILVKYLTMLYLLPSKYFLK